MKEIEFKLKMFDKEKADLDKQHNNDLLKLKPLDFEDFVKNHNYIKKVRNLKNKIKDLEKKLKDVEGLQKEVV